MQPNEPVTVYFGERWDAPMLDGAIHQVDTPVGQACLHCAEPITSGDRGVLRACMHTDQKVTTEPVHMECDLRMGVGSLAHLHGRCSCRNPGVTEPEPTSLRADALAVLAYFNEQRAKAGMRAL
jgi:hypothetical protein